MCVPLAPALIGASLAIEVGSRIADHKAQSDQSDAVEREARRAQTIDRQAISVRQIEEGIAASRQLRDTRREGQQRAGAIEASAAAAGVTGSNVDLLLGDLEGSVGRATADILDSYTASVESLERQKLAVDAAAESRIAGAPAPSNLATGLRIGGAVTNAVADYKALGLKGD